MKQGGIINADAYIRLAEYAVKIIRERMENHLLPCDSESKWKDYALGVFTWKSKRK
jgi:hypothetical protein